MSDLENDCDRIEGRTTAKILSNQQSEVTLTCCDASQLLRTVHWLLPGLCQVPHYLAGATGTQVCSSFAREQFEIMPLFSASGVLLGRVLATMAVRRTGLDRCCTCHMVCVLVVSSIV